MAKFVCTVCGYVYEGDAAPAECPVCHVGADKFKEVEGELTLAAEHEYGIYAKTVKNNPDISEEDKQKLLLAMNEMFFMSKQINKEKYAKKSDKDKK